VLLDFLHSKCGRVETGLCVALRDNKQLRAVYSSRGTHGLSQYFEFKI
jgi:hypothetical protein